MPRTLRTFAAVGVFGLCACVGAVVARDILQPQLTPEKGSYEKPEGKLGEKPDQPWSVTTVAAAVDGKPVPGKVTTVTGEIIDLSCYLQVGKHGGKHRDCGQKCLKAGQPIGLLAKDGTVYLLMEEEHDPRRDGLTNFRQAAIDHMAYVMEVTGTYSEVAGQKALFVTGYLKK
ncbi:MAG TPA: hypothetical protein VM529_02570 [Gemmata sp.]|nr:hypothetical protein [Gemmata sp.]